MKTFEVYLEAYAVVIVRAKNSEEAEEMATDEISFGDLELDVCRSTVLKTQQQIESAKRHAQKVI